MPRDGFCFNRRVAVLDGRRIYLRTKWLDLRSRNKVKHSPTGKVFFHSIRRRRNRQKVCINNNFNVLMHKTCHKQLHRVAR